MKKCKKEHYNDYNSTYLELVDKAKVPTLQVRRIRTMALETFKIINNLSPTCLNSLVRIKTSKYSSRYSNIQDLPRVRTSTYGKKSFEFAAASLWNSLPGHFRRKNSFSQFRRLIQSWNGSECHCSACI